MPAFWALRGHFRDAELSLLCDVQPDAGIVVARDLVTQTGIFDRILTYPRATGLLRKFWSCSQLAFRLRHLRFDTLVYLAPIARSEPQIHRDRRFFRACGIRRFIGMDYVFRPPPRADGRPLPELPREVDLLLDRLRRSGIPVPPPGRARLDLALTEADEARLDALLADKAIDHSRPWVAVGPGSKMPAKRWPEDRYGAVVKRLIDRYSVWPVVFGGPEDHACAERLIASWGEGTNAAGWPIRAAAAALGRCRLYLGNDTGTMHLAASAGTRCVAVFSARDYPGRWYPYGAGHKVLRKRAPCEGCMLADCVDRKMECMRSIAVEDVSAACCEMLDETVRRDGL